MRARVLYCDGSCSEIASTGTSTYPAEKTDRDLFPEISRQILQVLLRENLRLYCAHRAMKNKLPDILAGTRSSWAASLQTRTVCCRQSSTIPCH
eukprot:scaffold114768_cov57-Attheya_sp.AAC.1